jgi:hypothetical protein
MFSCPICPQHYSELISLSVHYRKQHKKTSQDLYVSLFCNNVIPLCKCGCGTQVKFLDITQGFREYKLGHASRVANNFQTEKSRSNSKSARRKMLEDGSWKPFVTKETGEHWSKGLTKETDERIRKMADTVSLPEESARRSERMRRNRLNGVVRTLHKEEHSQWKGGVTSLLSYCHSNKKLFTEWKYPKLLKSNFSCEKCGASRDANPRPLLEVHHDKQRMSETHCNKLAGEAYIVPNYIETKLPKEKRMECRGIVKTINEYGISQRMKLYLIYLLALELENRESMVKITRIVGECKDTIEDSKIVVGNEPTGKKILLG